MSAALRRRHTPEDIWQETLLHAWRDRARYEWRGFKSFRFWLMFIIDNRICAAAAHERAAKRGGSTPVPFSAFDQSGSQRDRESNFPARWPRQRPAASRYFGNRPTPCGRRCDPIAAEFFHLSCPASILASRACESSVLPER